MQADENDQLQQGISLLQQQLAVMRAQLLAVKLSHDGHTPLPPRREDCSPDAEDGSTPGPRSAVPDPAAGSDRSRASSVACSELSLVSKTPPHVRFSEWAEDNCLPKRTAGGVSEAADSFRSCISPSPTYSAATSSAAASLSLLTSTPPPHLPFSEWAEVCGPNCDAATSSAAASLSLLTSTPPPHLPFDEWAEVCGPMAAAAKEPSRTPQQQPSRGRVGITSLSPPPVLAPPPPADSFPGWAVTPGGVGALSPQQGDNSPIWGMPLDREAASAASMGAGPQPHRQGDNSPMWGMPLTALNRAASTAASSCHGSCFTPQSSAEVAGQPVPIKADDGDDGFGGWVAAPAAPPGMPSYAPTPEAPVVKSTGAGDSGEGYRSATSSAPGGGLSYFGATASQAPSFVPSSDFASPLSAWPEPSARLADHDASSPTWPGASAHLADDASSPTWPAAAQGGSPLQGSSGFGGFQAATPLVAAAEGGESSLQGGSHGFRGFQSAAPLVAAAAFSAAPFSQGGGDGFGGFQAPTPPLAVAPFSQDSLLGPPPAGSCPGVSPPALPAAWPANLQDATSSAAIPSSWPCVQADASVGSAAEAVGVPDHAPAAAATLIRGHPVGAPGGLGAEGLCVHASHLTTWLLGPPLSSGSKVITSSISNLLLLPSCRPPCAMVSQRAPWSSHSLHRPRQWLAPLARQWR